MLFDDNIFFVFKSMGIIFNEFKKVDNF